MADAVSAKSVDLVQLPTRSESVVPSHSAGFVTSQACEERTHQRARIRSSSDLSVSPGRRTGQFYVPDHQERIKEFRERCLVSRAKSATLPQEEMDWAPRVPLHISCVPELITPKKSAIGERMHLEQRVYLTPHVFWTVGRLCVSVGDQFVMEF